jgi:hypothetical protein
VHGMCISTFKPQHSSCINIFDRDAAGVASQCRLYRDVVESIHEDVRKLQRE